MTVDDAHAFSKELLMRFSVPVTLTIGLDRRFEISVPSDAVSVDTLREIIQEAEKRGLVFKHGVTRLIFHG